MATSRNRRSGSDCAIRISAGAASRCAERRHDLVFHAIVGGRIHLQEVVSHRGATESAELAHSGEADELRACLRDVDHDRAGVGAPRLRQHKQRAARLGRVADFERDVLQHRNHFLRVRAHEAAERLDPQIGIGEIAFRHPCRRRKWRAGARGAATGVVGDTAAGGTVTAAGRGIPSDAGWSAPVAPRAPAVQRERHCGRHGPGVREAPGLEGAEQPCTTAHRCAACAARSRCEAIAPA